jgi:phosphate starvation-inducible PhoH-like protein
VRLTFDDNGLLRALAGQQGDHLKSIEAKLGVAVNVRGNQVTLAGATPAIETAEAVLRQLYGLVQRGYALFPADVDRAILELSANRAASLADIFLDKIVVASGNRVVSPRGLSQKRYVEAIREHDIVFGVGPAGTGKTYLAVSMAVAALTRRDVKRLILTRPAVEAGEKLGYLPGDLSEKINPYLRPLYDALYDLMEPEAVVRLVERGTIEIAPLAFMRGRTLNDAFVILDEAQNTSVAQMKMFLTRLGQSSRVVVTGDTTQIDLPGGCESGLVDAIEILRTVEGVAICRFDSSDVVRHPLVARVIDAYERAESGNGGRAKEPR